MIKKKIPKKDPQKCDHKDRYFNGIVSIRGKKGFWDGILTCKKCLWSWHANGTD